MQTEIGHDLSALVEASAFGDPILATEYDREASVLRRWCSPLRAKDFEALGAIQSLLFPPVPVVNGIETAASYKTAHSCGGDYYTIAELSDGRLGVFIADVSGVGLLTVALTAVIATIVERDRERWANPESLLHELNQRFCSINLPDGAFITAFCGVLDRKSSFFTYSSAGHPHPRIYRALSHIVLPLDDASTLPLGIESDNVYTQRDIALRPDDTLILYTDGIIEARSDNQEFFAIDRLDEVLNRLPHATSASATVNELCAAVADFSQPGGLLDDQTLVAVKFQKAA